MIKETKDLAKIYQTMTKDIPLSKKGYCVDSKGKEYSCKRCKVYEIVDHMATENYTNSFEVLTIKGNYETSKMRYGWVLCATFDTIEDAAQYIIKRCKK